MHLQCWNLSDIFADHILNTNVTNKSFASALITTDIWEIVSCKSITCTCSESQPLLIFVASWCWHRQTLHESQSQIITRFHDGINYNPCGQSALVCNRLLTAVAASLLTYLSHLQSIAGRSDNTQLSKDVFNRHIPCYFNCTRFQLDGNILRKEYHSMVPMCHITYQVFT